MGMQESDWYKYRSGIDNNGKTHLKFQRKDWDLGSEHLIGKTFKEIIPELVRESRFHPTMFTPENWIGEDHGGILNTLMFVYTPHQHESKGQQRLTNSDQDNEYWVAVAVSEEGGMIGFNPLAHIQKFNVGIGWTTKVTLNNLTCPGTYGGTAHFPMLDIVKPPTPENIQHVISETKKRCGLEKFLVLKSSDQGMMVVGLELVDEPNLLNIWDNAELMNHREVDRDDYWFDSRWHTRSQQCFRKDIGLPNRHQVTGILRTNAIPPLKPFEPLVIATSFTQKENSKTTI